MVRCEICGRSFKTLQGVRSHKRVHPKKLKWGDRWIEQDKWKTEQLRKEIETMKIENPAIGLFTLGLGLWGIGFILFVLGIIFLILFFLIFL